VVLADGQLAGFIERGGRSLLTFSYHEDALTAGLIDIAERGAGSITIATIDGESAHKSPLGDALLGAGFATGYKGLTFRR
jgi:ATP-dependent Lhr-like helicase